VKVVVVSGIWPPDVGGPASHAPALADALVAAGHEVEVVTTADTTPESRGYPVHWVSRTRRAPLRHFAVVRAVLRSARGADRVYATTMIRRAAIAAALARRPLVVKLVADEAYERERRSGRFEGTLEEFQRTRGGARLRLLRSTRNAALRRARRILVPSEYLRRIAVGWNLDATRVSVVPNPAPELPSLPGREEARAALAIQGFSLGSAGRLTAQKGLGDALEALTRVDGVELLVLGDGPSRAELEGRASELGLAARVRFLGPGRREDVLRLFRAVDAVLLTSAWENLPHTLLESLAVGTPVIATAVGGIPEVLRDGENGLLVPARDVAAIAGAIGRLARDEHLRRTLAAATGPSVAELAEPRILQRIVRAIEEEA
jgi:glycosyltransferase involved in cell wall biosynthesis